MSEVNMQFNSTLLDAKDVDYMKEDNEELNQNVEFIGFDNEKALNSWILNQNTSSIGVIFDEVSCWRKDMFSLRIGSVLGHVQFENLLNLRISKIYRFGLRIGSVFAI